MANYIISPNMSLVIPSVGIDPGPDWATNLNASLTILDQHDHSPGKGVQITPDGLNISSILSFQGNYATLLLATRFEPQSAALTGPNDLGELYVLNADLYYIDTNGNQIRITQSGGIVGTPGSISGLTSPASATYVSSDQTFVWQSAANTPANLDAGSITLRDIVANSPGVTLSPISDLGSSYTLTLPTLPTVTSVMTLTASGIMRTNTYDQVGQGMTSVGADAIAASIDSTGANAILNTFTTISSSQADIIAEAVDVAGADSIGATMNFTGANAIATQVTRAASNNPGIGGISISSSSGTFSTASTTYVQVTNLSTVLETTSRPVMINLIQDFTTNPMNIGATSGWSAELQRNGTPIGVWNIGTSGVTVPSFTYIDVVGGGTYTYALFVKTNSAALAFEFARLSAYEL